MSLVVPPQRSCYQTWREAVRLVDDKRGHEAHNVLMTVSDPIASSPFADSRVTAIDDYLQRHNKSVRTVANTIFPESLYRRHGAPDFFDAFHKKVLPTVRKSKDWSGYYFERMTHWPGAPGGNPLWDLVDRMRDPKVKTLNKFELALFDPARDLNRSVYGGQCLSFLSFKLMPGDPKLVALTAVYRNHYYVEKLLGNLIGLSRLMSFVANETELAVGPLTVLSTHAEIDMLSTNVGGRDTRADFERLLIEIDDLPPE